MRHAGLSTIGAILCIGTIQISMADDAAHLGGVRQSAKNTGNHGLVLLGKSTGTHGIFPMKSGVFL